MPQISLPLVIEWLGYLGPLSAGTTAGVAALEQIREVLKAHGIAADTGAIDAALVDARRRLAREEALGAAGIAETINPDPVVDGSEG
jgi:hypothetical protein